MLLMAIFLAPQKRSTDQDTINPWFLQEKTFKKLFDESLVIKKHNKYVLCDTLLILESTVLIVIIIRADFIKTALIIYKNKMQIY